MGVEFFLVAVVLLACFAIFDLAVGVSDDAANFLNSSIGSRVAPRHVIMIVASLGILAGVTFSSGMMEVARKGIFHPHLFTMPELIYIFMAVMITDIILLDMFNAYGLPTSTTVSIVFELLGAATAVSLLKLWSLDHDLTTLVNYINTSKALLIIIGILLSIVVAFAGGAIVQVLSRLLFTYDYKSRLKRYGAVWGGVALTSITYFILIKGAKGASFISPDQAQWIATHGWSILLIILPISIVVLQMLLLLKVNVFKPIVLIGTFALALAFAANDLMNFIGVPMAGYHAYEAAVATQSPLTVTMGALDQKVPTETYLLLLAGAIMVATLWVSRKARAVSETEISLSQQDEGLERFDSSMPSRLIVRLILNAFDTVRNLVPSVLRKGFRHRLDLSSYRVETDPDHRPRYDLLRASVNLMVASAVISYATSRKLPLSTTYVTFMVAMGTSFADQAWGRESAVYRVSGVLAVIGGWFMTALLAFSVSLVFATVIFYGEEYGVIGLIALGAAIIFRNHRAHKERSKSKEMDEIFNLKKVSDLSATVQTTFDHISYLVRELRVSLAHALEALFAQDESGLAREQTKIKKFQRWSNIVVANIFKAMRLTQKEEIHSSLKYGQTIRRLQKLVDGHRDIVMRSHEHVANHHSGLLDVQVRELRTIKDLLDRTLGEVEAVISRAQEADRQKIYAWNEELRRLASHYHKGQLERIYSEESKTRLTILYYSIIGDAMMLSKQSIKILEIFEESFGDVERADDFDLD